MSDLARGRRDAESTQPGGNRRAGRVLPAAALLLGLLPHPSAAAGAAADVVIRGRERLTVFLDLRDPFGHTALVKPKARVEPLVGPGIVGLLGPWTVTNQGRIRVPGSIHSGIDLFGGEAVVNEGSIEGAGRGVFLSDLLSCSCTQLSVVNSGSILGRTGAGVALDGAGSVTNSGTISGATQGVHVLRRGTVTNSGTISGQTGLGLDSGGTVTNSGQILGAGFGIRSMGSASVFNSGTISGSLWAIEFGAGDDVLTLRTGSVLNGPVEGAGGTDTIFLEGVGSEDSLFQNFERLVMQGTDWTLGGSIAVGALEVQSGLLHVTGLVAGTTTVAGGTLDLGGTLAGPAFVMPGGLLEGSGRTGSLENRGTVSPGNSIGTLTVNGDFTSQPGATLRIEVNAAGDSDRLAVTGAATLNGGTVQVVPDQGATGAERDYTILTAAGGVAGAFSGLVEEFPFLDHRLTYLPNAVLLTAFRNQASFQDVAVCPNQFQTGLALDAAEGDPSASADMGFVTAALAGEGDMPRARRFLDEVGAASRPAVDFVNLQSLQAFQDAITARSATLNLDASLPGAGFAATSGTPAAALPSSGSASALARSFAGPVGSAAAAGSSGAWLRGVGLFGDRDSAGCPGQGYVYDLGGAALGADQAFGRELALGAAFASGYSTASVKQLSDELRAFHAHGALYGAYTPDHARDVRLNGAFTAGYIGNDTSRSISTTAFSRRASGDFGSLALSMRIEASGIAWSPAGIAVRPKLGFAYFHLGDSAYDESQAGSLDLAVESHDVNSLQSRIGLQVSRLFAAGEGWTVEPGLVAQWSRELLSVDQTVDARFAGSPASGFEVTGSRPERDRALLGAGIVARLDESLALSAGYLANLASDETSQTVQAGIRISW